MSQQMFKDLVEELHVFHGLKGSSRFTVREILAITLFILTHNESVRATCECFQHSTETVSRYFAQGVDALVSLSRNNVVPLDPSFRNTPREILNDSRYMPYFKNCIGAIDGTHVVARVPNDEKVAYIGRCGMPTQNILAVVHFNMCFTFIMAGWEGSAHDSRILKFVILNKQYKFSMPPQGKYYLVDAGFSMQRGFLKPYPDTRYHIPDFERSSEGIRGRKEAFNKRHSSLRGVIERTFGVWKKKWAILQDMPTYLFKKQVAIVAATTALHNYIRRHDSEDDVDFQILDENPDHIYSEAYEYHTAESTIGATTADLDSGEGVQEMKQLREDITDAVFASSTT